MKIGYRKNDFKMKIIFKILQEGGVIREQNAVTGSAHVQRHG